MPSALFVNAKVWQPSGRFDEAFGIDGNSINFTGTNEDALSMKSDYDEVSDLGGRLVLPGLIDGHLHLVKGSQMRRKLDCSKIRTKSELLDAVAAYTKRGKTDWIIGGNLDINMVFSQSDRTEGNFADRFSSEVPLYLTNYDYHSAICNSKAFEFTGLVNHLGDYTAEEIERTPAGKPTGLLREKSLNYIISVLPVPSLGEKTEAVIDFIKVLHSYGITSVSDITLPEDIDVYTELYNRGKLKIRVNSYIPFTEFENLEQYLARTRQIDSDLFTINGFKAYWDGALGSETALYSRNYLNRGHNGYKTELVSTGEIYELAKRIDKSGRQMIIHAIGDKAVTEVLDLYSNLTNTKTLRHRIEHAQHIQPADYNRFEELGVIASVQPLHLKYDARTVYEKLPAELIPLTHNYLHLINSGAVVNFGTDFPIVEFDPFENIRLAVTRNAENGVFTPELSISLHECIKCYTWNNAISNHNDSAVGTITKGRIADFVIMEDDLFEMAGESISQTRVFKTYLGGEEVYSIS
jgi:predicted amidohydrolase YtcJ